MRALQEQEFERLGGTRTLKVNVRLIAATNRNLEEMVTNREFRSDLCYRLNVFPIRVPPLRARIIEETINALSPKKRFIDHGANKQRDEIVRALTESMGRVGGPDGAAARIGINRTTLLARMRKFGIDARQYA